MVEARHRLALHGYPTGNCLRAAIALEEAGLAHSTVLVDLRRGAQSMHDHLSLDPFGKVPVLVEEDGSGATFVLTQSNAICLRADALAPGRIMPVGDRHRSIALERWFAFLTDAIAPNHAAFALSDPRFADAASLLVRRSIAAIHRTEAWVREQPFMAGRDFSLADVAAFTVASSVSQHLDWKGHAHLEDWFDRVGRRPAVVRGMTAFRS